MMNVMDVPQAEADLLLQMEKCRIDDNLYKFPQFGGAVRIPLKSRNLKEDFILDIQRMKIQLKKNTFQNRARKSIVLARIDIGGAPHRNPDGKEILCPHIHLYQEGFDDKWAYHLPDTFTDSNDIWLTLQEFMKFCNITQIPYIERGLLI